MSLLGFCTFQKEPFGSELKMKKQKNLCYILKNAFAFSKLTYSTFSFYFTSFLIDIEDEEKICSEYTYMTNMLLRQRKVKWW